MVNDVAVVSTTINPCPLVYAEWVPHADVIVAGDLNTPPAFYEFARDQSFHALTPDEQMHWRFSEAIGWRCIQRRNAAIMTAFAGGYPHILTVDDDNWPRPSAYEFIDGHVVALGPAKIENTLTTYSGFLNLGSLCIPRFHARGTPYGMSTDEIRTVQDTVSRVVVSQAQVIGDPDCDAVERICHAPDVKAVATDAVIAPGTYAAFNSQATMWVRDWAPVMAVLPGIGRYDDIFASFIFHRLARTYGVALHAGAPVMRQDRNEHNLTADLRAENWGMRHVLTFCQALDRAHISADMPIHEAYGNLIAATSRVLPPATVAFANEWVKVWRQFV